MAKVSIIMPVYNGEQYLAEAIQSIVTQTFTDWELIIVNDGSIDSSVPIVHGFTDDRIILLNQTNSGQAVSRNNALAIAHGKYITFLDADDLFLPNALATNAKFLDNNIDVMVVYSDGYYCDKHGSPIMQFSTQRLNNYDGFVLPELSITPFTCAIICVMIRKYAIDTIELKFDSAIRFGEDWNFLLELARDNIYGYNPEITCKYRIHAGNISYSNDQLRRDNLGKIRLRLLNLPESTQFDNKTKYTLFYQLLFDSYSNVPGMQLEIINSNEFSNLPGQSGARLLRLLASSWLVNGYQKTDILPILYLSRRLDHADIITWLLIVSVQFSRFFTREILVLKKRLFSKEQNQDIFGY